MVCKNVYCLKFRYLKNLLQRRYCQQSQYHIGKSFQKVHLSDKFLDYCKMYTLLRLHNRHLSHTHLSIIRSDVIYQVVTQMESIQAHVNLNQFKTHAPPPLLTKRWSSAKKMSIKM